MFALSLTMLKYTFSEMKLNFATRNKHIPIQINKKKSYKTGMVLVRLVWYEIQSQDWWFMYVLIRCRPFTQVWLTALSYCSCGIKRVKEKINYHSFSSNYPQYKEWLLSATNFHIFFVNMLINCILFQTLEFNYISETYSIFQNH